MTISKTEAFCEINQLQNEYVDNLISVINDPKYSLMKAINFTSPTGTGKTKMMSKLINHFPEYYFIVTTLSRGQLHFQVRNELSVDCIKDNYYVYGSADYRINSKLEANDIIGRIPPDTPCIWLRDEGHIKTNRFDELLKTHCYKVINFSATNEYSDIKCNFTNTMMLRTVNQSCGTPQDAILKLIDVKKAHRAISGYNPCAIFRCVGNDKKLYDSIINLCNDYDLKYIDLIDKTPDVTIAELCKDDSEYDVIINKFKITEGIDIKRAHVLYMDNKPNNNATTIQVIGRCRRNALLYRNDIDILAQENKSLLEKTRECYVFYNVEKTKLDLDENGELQYAFCDHISCEELKPNTVVEVVNGQLPNGLYILELEGQTGRFEINVDDSTGNNIVVPNTDFYNTCIVDNSFVYIGDTYSRKVKSKIKIENIEKFPISTTRRKRIFDQDIRDYKWVEEECDPYYDFKRYYDVKLMAYDVPSEAVNAFDYYWKKYRKTFSNLLDDNYIANIHDQLSLPDEKTMDKYISKYRKKLSSKVRRVNDEIFGLAPDRSTGDGVFLIFLQTLRKDAFAFSFRYREGLRSTVRTLLNDSLFNTAVQYYCILEYDQCDNEKSLDHISSRLSDFFEFIHKSIYITSVDAFRSEKSNLKDYSRVIETVTPFVSILFDDDKYTELKTKVFVRSLGHLNFSICVPYDETLSVGEQKIEGLFKCLLRALQRSIFLNYKKTGIAQIRNDITSYRDRLNQGIIDLVRYDYSSLFENITEQDSLIAANIRTRYFFDETGLSTLVLKNIQRDANKKIVINDRESATIGVDRMQLLSDSNTWVESKSVTSKVGRYNKLNSYISRKYEKELAQAQPQLFTGRNAFDLDKRCNSCLGYCVEYYSKYLLYGYEYLGDFIYQAQKEAHTNKATNRIVVRACMLKYKAMMMIAFGSSVSRLIKTISVEKLSQYEYKAFLKLVVDLGTRTAEYVKNTLYKDCEPTNLVDPNLSIRHITGLADYITKDTILDVKVRNNIDEKCVRQVLAYHYLSTKRSDLQVSRVIIYDASSNRAVVINISDNNITR